MPLIILFMFILLKSAPNPRVLVKCTIKYGIAGTKDIMNEVIPVVNIHDEFAHISNIAVPNIKGSKGDFSLFLNDIANIPAKSVPRN
ncbi:MAG: hypothetical protein DRP29_08320 [Thermodesulfobacteriota bacterium]|nr:MAG: hypothetical protein DRP29_08320 [Thermodesulfobacteriota bacterium]